MVVPEHISEGAGAEDPCCLSGLLGILVYVPSAVLVGLSTPGVPPGPVC